MKTVVLLSSSSPGSAQRCKRPRWRQLLLERLRRQDGVSPLLLLLWWRCRALCEWTCVRAPAKSCSPTAEKMTKTNPRTTRGGGDGGAQTTRWPEIVCHCTAGHLDRNHFVEHA